MAEKARRGRRQVLALTAAACLSASIMAAGSVAAQARSAAVEHRPTPASSPLGRLPDKVASLGSSRLADVYGSMMVTRGGTHMVVFLTALNRHAEALVRAAVGRQFVSFAKTPHTRLHLLAVQAKITAHVRQLARQGIKIVSWFPGINGDGLDHIGVENLTPARARILERLFGKSNIVLQNIPADGVPVATGRNSDFSPWNGGDNLTSNGEGCTSAVGINYAGHSYMLTAAHCYEPGWSVYNALAGQAGTFMGTESSRDTNYGGDDTALLSMSPSSLVWTGIIGHPVQKAVAGDATNPDGDTVYNEGAYSGEVSSVVQNNFFGCTLVSGYAGIGSRYECNLVEAYSSGIANQSGDSGGPMIRYINGNLEVTGIVSASPTNSRTPCQYNITTCYHYVYYTAMDEILSTEYPGSTIP